MHGPVDALSHGQRKRAIAATDFDNITNLFVHLQSVEDQVDIEQAYPPDLQEEATKTVLARPELLCADWAA